MLFIYELFDTCTYNGYQALLSVHTKSMSTRLGSFSSSPTNSHILTQSTSSTLTIQFSKLAVASYVCLNSMGARLSIGVLMNTSLNSLINPYGIVKEALHVAKCGCKCLERHHTYTCKHDYDEPSVQSCQHNKYDQSVPATFLCHPFLQ